MLYTEQDFTVSWFAGGEVNVRLKEDVIRRFEIDDVVNLAVRVQDSDDLISALMMADAIRKYKISIRQFNLYIPYLPYARQDRVCAKGEAFSLQVLAKVLNSQGFDKVISFDAHSVISDHLINSFMSVSNFHFVWSVLREYDLTKEKIVLVAPDAGASKRIELLQNYLKGIGYDYEIVYGIKTRASDGSISKHQIAGDVQNPESKEFVVVDDICDGGRTFVSLAKALVTFGVRKSHMHLLTSHGIYSYGQDHLKEAGYNVIISTDSFMNEYTKYNIYNTFNAMLTANGQYDDIKK